MYKIKINSNIMFKNKIEKLWRFKLKKSYQCVVTFGLTCKYIIFDNTISNILTNIFSKQL